MATRPTKTINMPDKDQSEPEQPEQRKRPESGQFRLQVDRQTKSTYATFEEAQKAGMAIKKSYPNLQVAVYDGVTNGNKLIELPTA
jgi:hypothetical protein